MALLNFLKRNKIKEGPKAPKQGEQKAQKDILSEESKVPDKKEELKPIELKSSKHAWRILRKPHVTEKATALIHLNQYVFRLIGNPTKPEVKKAIEEAHGVHVEKVRKISVPKKQRKRGRHMGWRSGYKKAIVTLREGEKIEILPH